MIRTQHFQPLCVEPHPDWAFDPPGAFVPQNHNDCLGALTHYHSAANHAPPELDANYHDFHTTRAPARYMDEGDLRPDNILHNGHGAFQHSADSRSFEINPPQSYDLPEDHDAAMARLVLQQYTSVRLVEFRRKLREMLQSHI